MLQYVLAYDKGELVVAETGYGTRFRSQTTSTAAAFGSIVAADSVREFMISAAEVQCVHIE